MIGKALLHYQIEASLGVGGMGEVYKALDTRLGRSVVVKVLPEIFAQDADRVARFERERNARCLLFRDRSTIVYGLAVDGYAVIAREIFQPIGAVFKCERAMRRESHSSSMEKWAVASRLIENGSPVSGHTSPAPIPERTTIRRCVLAHFSGCL